MENSKELNMKTDWNNVLDLIKKHTFAVEYKDYIVYPRNNGYFIKKISKIINDKIESKTNAKNNEKDGQKNNEKEVSEKIFLFDTIKKIKIYFNDKIFESIDIFTNLEIDEYIKT